MSETCPECDGYVLTVFRETKYFIWYRCEDCGYNFRVYKSGATDDD